VEGATRVHVVALSLGGILTTSQENQPEAIKTAREWTQLYAQAKQ
jgi:hypothetical protein